MDRFAQAFGETVRTIVNDRVAMLTLVGAVVLYSFFYPAAYRHQVAGHLPLVVVDQDHSPMSRSVLRKLDAVRAMHVAGVAGSMDEARVMLERGGAEAVLLVPADFERDILRGGQGRLALIGNGTLLGRASVTMQGAALAITALGQEVAVRQAQCAGLPAPAPLRVIERPLFNTAEGYGSSIVPGVAALIAQQTLLIGVVVLAATQRERHGRLRLSRPGLCGIAAAFAVIGMLSLLYFSGFVFWFQDYPRAGNLAGLLLAGALFTVSVVGFALFFGSFFRTRRAGLPAHHRHIAADVLLVQPVVAGRGHAKAAGAYRPDAAQHAGDQRDGQTQPDGRAVAGGIGGSGQPGHPGAALRRAGDVALPTGPGR